MGQWAKSASQHFQVLKPVTQPKTQQVWLVQFGFDPNKKITQPKLFGLVWINSGSQVTRTCLHS